MRILWIFLLFGSSLLAQRWPVVDDTWTVAKFHSSEEEVKTCVAYLLTNDCGTDPIERFDAVSFIDQWTNWVPYITFELEVYLLEATRDSPEMLIQYICHKLDYFFNHPNAEINNLEVELIGVNGMLNLYQKGGCVSNETLDHWLQLRADGRLEKFVKSKVPVSWD